MELDGFAHEFEDFVERVRGGDTAREIGNVGRVVVAGFFDDDCLLHMGTVTLPGLA